LSATSGNGRVRIRCSCGGKHQDNTLRLHGMWNLAPKKKVPEVPKDKEGEASVEENKEENGKQPQTVDTLSEAGMETGSESLEEDGQNIDDESTQAALRAKRVPISERFSAGIKTKVL